MNGDIPSSCRIPRMRHTVDLLLSEHSVGLPEEHHHYSAISVQVPVPVSAPRWPFALGHTDK